MDGRKDILGVWIGEHVIQAEVQKSYAQAIGEMGPAISAGGGGSGNMGDLLGRGYLALEDENWEKARELFDQVLNIEVPQRAAVPCDDP